MAHSDPGRRSHLSGRSRYSTAFRSRSGSVSWCCCSAATHPPVHDLQDDPRHRRAPLQLMLLASRRHQPARCTRTPSRSAWRCVPRNHSSSAGSTVQENLELGDLHRRQARSGLDRSVTSYTSCLQQREGSRAPFPQRAIVAAVGQALMSRPTAADEQTMQSGLSPRWYGRTGSSRTLHGSGMLGADRRAEAGDGAVGRRPAATCCPRRDRARRPAAELLRSDLERAYLGIVLMFLSRVSPLPGPGGASFSTANATTP